MLPFPAMFGLGTLGWQAAVREAAALGTAALSIPFGRLLPAERFEPGAEHRTPVVFVHGLFGDPTNFLVLRNRLARRGVPCFASFAYRPSLDYQRLAVRLGETIARVRSEARAPQVDVVGHSLGGTVGRYFTAIDDRRTVRRLVTLGAPHYGGHFARPELAIFGARDPLVPAPHPRHTSHRRMRIIPDCGHFGLLYHPAALDEVVEHLTSPMGASAAGREAA